MPQSLGPLHTTHYTQPSEHFSAAPTHTHKHTPFSFSSQRLHTSSWDLDSLYGAAPTLGTWSGPRFQQIYSTGCMRHTPQRLESSGLGKRGAATSPQVGCSRLSPVPFNLSTRNFQYRERSHREKMANTPPLSIYHMGELRLRRWSTSPRSAHPRSKAWVLNSPDFAPGTWCDKTSV